MGTSPLKREFLTHERRHDYGRSVSSPNGTNGRGASYLNAQNPDLRFERTLSGEISLSPPTGLSTGSQNSELNAQIVIWNRSHGHGKVLDSSTGISIGLNGAPDAGWISGERYDRIPKKQRTEFLKTPPRTRLRTALAERPHGHTRATRGGVGAGRRHDRRPFRPAFAYGDPVYRNGPGEAHDEATHD